MTSEDLTARKRFDAAALRRALRLYAVTDRTWLGAKTGDAAISALATQIETALRGGATVVQLREKNLNVDEFRREAVAVKRLCERFGVPLIIDDALDVALECDADGLHVGQRDLEAGEARRLLGPNRILGVSAQTVADARLAVESGADYLGVGAVFPTATKADADAVSLETLRAICDAVSVPVVAIGGIGAAQVERLTGTGIVGVAVVSAIFGSADVEAATRELERLTRRFAED
ncbi:MAG: thiamine phosphate synthase [Thermoguttaceae bacterium]|nr:thiamine phosphate synthase [Thermoguttaceae bacterium]